MDIALEKQHSEQRIQLYQQNVERPMGWPVPIPSLGQLALLQTQLRYSSGAGPLSAGILDVATWFWGRRLLTCMDMRHIATPDHGAESSP